MHCRLTCTHVNLALVENVEINSVELLQLQRCGTDVELLQLQGSGADVDVLSRASLTVRIFS